MIHAILTPSNLFTDALSFILKNAKVTTKLKNPKLSFFLLLVKSKKLLKALVALNTSHFRDLCRSGMSIGQNYRRPVVRFAKTLETFSGQRSIFQIRFLMIRGSFSYKLN